MSLPGPISSSVSPTSSALVQQAAFVRDDAAPQADHGQSEAAAKPGLDHRLADQLRGRRHDHLRHADLLRSVGEIGAAQRQRFQRKLLPERLDVCCAARTGRSAGCRRPAAPSSRSGAGSPWKTCGCARWRRCLRRTSRAGSSPRASCRPAVSDPSREGGTRGPRVCTLRSSRRSSDRSDSLRLALSAGSQRRAKIM